MAEQAADTLHELGCSMGPAQTHTAILSLDLDRAPNRNKPLRCLFACWGKTAKVKGGGLGDALPMLWNGRNPMGLRLCERVDDWNK